MADLFTLEELASYLQVPEVDTSTATLCRSLATALVLDETGPLESQTSTVTLPIVDSYVHLPVRYVTAVTTVTVGGVAATFEWEKPYPRVLLKSWSATANRWQTADVTLTHGWATVPAVAKAVALSVAARAYTNPNGYRTEAIDDYSVTRAGADDDLAGLTLTVAERLALGRGLATSAYVTNG